MMDDWYGNEHGTIAWIVMALVMIVFWGGLIAVAVTLLRRPHAANQPEAVKPPHYDAEKILSERFAHGDIDEAEFKARRAALRRS
jgi:putative membrane protein